MQHKITQFDKSNGNIVVKVEGFTPFALDIPIHEVTGKYLTGEEFDVYLNGLLPTHVIERKEKIKAGIANESEFLEFIKQNHGYEEIIKPQPDPSQLKWAEIRYHRTMLLAKSFDPKLPYIIMGDLQEQELEKLKQYRQQLLDVPQVIQSKIDSGEIASVLDIDVNTYSWPVLEN